MHSHQTGLKTLKGKCCRLIIVALKTEWVDINIWQFSRILEATFVTRGENSSFNIHESDNLGLNVKGILGTSAKVIAQTKFLRFRVSCPCVRKYTTACAQLVPQRLSPHT